MEWIGVGFWSVLLDVAALSVCGITVVYILGKKKRQTGRDLQDPSAQRIENIVAQTFDRLIYHYPGVSFNRMVETVARGGTVRPSRGIHRVLDGGGLKSEAVEPNRRPVITPDPVEPLGGRIRDAKSMRVFQFTASGMSVKKISEKLEMPRCEVELIAKFQQRETSRSAVL